MTSADKNFHILGQRVSDILTSLFEYSLMPEFKQERQIALELFLISTGKINDDDPFYEARIACFHEYFVFDYRLSGVFSGSTLFETFLFNAQKTFSIEELSDYESLRCMRHSLFEVENKKENHLVIFDMLAGSEVKAYPLTDHTFSGMEQRRIFEGRLVHLGGISFLTGNFILHSSQVRLIIEEQVDAFLSGNSYCKSELSIDWDLELNTRHELLESLANQKNQIQNEKQKPIEILKITKQIAELPKKISDENLVMALGKNKIISPYVPESPFFNTTTLLQKLAFSQIRSYRYKHIDPIKIYEQGDGKNLDIKLKFAYPAAQKVLNKAS